MEQDFCLMFFPKDMKMVQLQYQQISLSKKWPQIFGSIELTQALIDRFTHRCEIFTFEGQSIRFSDSKKEKPLNNFWP